MAKVYSWQVSERTYAYIIDPNDPTSPRVGSELTSANDLQTISDWAQNASDTEYDAQFEKMKEKCVAAGYNVDFEEAGVYRSVVTTCDNLRGPAGRGIQKIEWVKDVISEGVPVSVYYLWYDDGDYDVFTIKNGINGKDGVDGTPGTPGDAGVSSKFIMIYTSGVDADGNIITPERPEGGSYNFLTDEFECPDGWIRNDGDDGELTPPIWQSTRTFTDSDISTDKRWSVPVQITGENGAPGADGTSTEFIYCLQGPKPDITNMPSDPDVNGYVPDESWGFKGSPQGVDEDNKTEWYCVRTKDGSTGKWGAWTGPNIWSKYGENGQDGDGVQYIYLKNDGIIPVNPTPYGFDQFDAEDEDVKKTCEEYQNKDTEWLPPVGDYINYMGDTAVTPCVKDVSKLTDGSEIGSWTDDPSDVDVTYQYAWVSSRKYRTVNGKKQWTKFSDPSLWGKFGENGKNATSIRRLYALSPSTSNPPDLPKDSSFTADWGTGFPKDYKNGENVVWGTEAEIWAHNFEFVYSYRKVSVIDKDGNVVKPSDATEENTLVVPYIPDEQVTGKTYLMYDSHYYKWDGGWGDPFPVTGVKGDDGAPVNYVTYAFAFGFTEFPPNPPSGSTASNPGQSSGGNNVLVSWHDFPDTMIGVDGIQKGGEYDGIDMRWYQCEGHVNGHTGEVVIDETTGLRKWTNVTPCNPRDGEGKTGPYYEFRFGITKDNNPPVSVLSDGKNWLREPSYYIDEEKCGWFETDELMPPIPPGGTMWQIWGLIEHDGEEDTVGHVKVVGGKGWNGPRRVSGEKGETGLQGPAGLRGVSGLPGVAQHTLYCLGTYGKEKSEYYFDHYDAYSDTNENKMGDGYFGSKDYQNKFVENLTPLGWYEYKDMPYSDIIRVTNDGEFNAAVSPEAQNDGRVVCYTHVEITQKSGSTFSQKKYQYFLVNRGGGYTRLTDLLDEKDNEEFAIYIWCIQGNDVYKAGSHKLYIELEGVPEDANSNNTQTVNTIPDTQHEGWKYLYNSSNGKYYTWKEIPGDEVKHTRERIEWSSPFKLQGTNGLRGLAGNRGQVVYPMGVYNHEEIYITTETKAPYVYDPNDGLFYVYNIVGEPWIGKLPDNYKEVMIDMDGDGKEEYYKYSTDGSGAEGTWYTQDQNGDTPANNFANAGSGETPAWVRFESFQALYTNIGIIANGMIGSAVYNNEFMFSQQGIDISGRTTNYAVVSGKHDDGGFLSGYKFDETGVQRQLNEGDGSHILLHWYYKDKLDANGDPVYLENTEVNPYEKNENGEYIHAFMPNVCINFATGEMWLSHGKIHFEADGAGYLAGKHINWTKDGEIIIGTPNETEDGFTGSGIVVRPNGSIDIGPLNGYVISNDSRVLAAETLLNTTINQIRGMGEDGWISPEERKTLKNEKSAIEKEYTQLIEQCNTYGLTADTHTYNDDYDNYKTGYNKAISALTYYTSTANTISDSADTHYKCIKIKNTGTGTTETHYGNIADYYRLKQNLQNALTLASELRSVASAVASANTYTEEQISGVSTTISNLETTVQNQLDKKINTWKQSYDPSSAWTATTICQEHFGDLWYNTDKGLIYTFDQKYSPNVSATLKAATSAGDYYWVRTDASLLAFDYSDGSSSIHYATSPTGYTVNDMWFIPEDQPSEKIPTDCKVKDTVVCTGVTSYKTNNADVNVATAFTASDWVKLDRYTDDSFAKEKFDDWAADGKLSPPERKALKDEANAIAAESGNTYTQAQTYLSGTSDSAYITTYSNAATYAYDTAMYYATGFTGTTASVPVSGTTSTGSTKSNYGNIKNYYTVRQNVQNKIVNQMYAAAKKHADDKTFLEGVFGSVLVNSGATLTGYLGITDGKSGVNHVVACIDGKGLVNVTGKGKLVLATGIPSGSTDLNKRMASATTKIYSNGLLETKNADISGKITVEGGGTVGGFTVGPKYLYSIYSDSTETTKNKLYNEYGYSLYTHDTSDNITVQAYIGTKQQREYELDWDTGTEPCTECEYGAGILSKVTGNKNSYQYLKALEVECSGTHSGTDYYGVKCNSGVFGGLRPKIVTCSNEKYNADEFDHTIIMTKQLVKKNENGTNTATVNIPRNPPKGQEYVILHSGAADAGLNDNKSSFFIKLSGSTGGKLYDIRNNLADRGTAIEFKGVNCECRLFYSGTNWYYTCYEWKGN